MGLLSAIGAVAGKVLGGGIDDIFNKSTADRSYEMNRRLQKHDQEFQKEMRATAYQTMVNDMEKAGINPAVALSNGGGTVMGGSSSASASAPSSGGTDLAQMMQATALTKAQQENIEADTELKTKQSGKTDAETKTENVLRNAKLELTQAQTEKERAAAQAELSRKLNLDFDAKMKKMDVDKRSGQYNKELQTYKAQIQAEMIEAGYDSSTIAQVIKTIGKTVQAINPLSAFTGRSNSAQKSYGYITTY